MDVVDARARQRARRAEARNAGAHDDDAGAPLHRGLRQRTRFQVAQQVPALGIGTDPAAGPVRRRIRRAAGQRSERRREEQRAAPQHHREAG